MPIRSRAALGAIGAVGVLGSLLAVVPMVYLAGFLVNLAAFPWTVDGNPPAPLGRALATDLALAGSFGVVHSLLARETVKRRLARWVPSGLERSVYSIVAGLQVTLLVVAWRSIPQPVWTSEGAARALLWAGNVAGWALVLAALAAVDTGHLFGLSQARAMARGETYRPPGLATRGVYRHLRHPLYAGFAIALWVHPDLSVGGAVLASVWTTYLFVGARLEERDLERAHGAAYLAWRDAVAPLGARRRRSAASRVVR